MGDPCKPAPLDRTVTPRSRPLSHGHTVVAAVHVRYERVERHRTIIPTLNLAAARVEAGMMQNGGAVPAWSGMSLERPQLHPRTGIPVEQ